MKSISKKNPTGSRVAGTAVYAGFAAISALAGIAAASRPFKNGDSAKAYAYGITASVATGAVLAIAMGARASRS